MLDSDLYSVGTLTNVGQEYFLLGRLSDDLEA